MKKIKQISALIAAILLFLLYASTIIFAILNSEYARRLLMASVVSTIVLPVLLFGLVFSYNVFNKRDQDDDDSKHV